MGRTLVVTDSSACMPTDMARSRGVVVVPLRIQGGEWTITDTSPEAAEMVARARAAGEPLKSSAPPPTDYLAAVEGSGADGAVVVTAPVEFTAMFRSAHVAARLASKPTVVVDCRSATSGQALVVLAAARAAAGGADLDQVVGVAERASRRCQMVASVDGLSYLGASGRVPSLMVDRARRRVRRSGHRSVFRVRQAHVELVMVAESDDAALDCMVEAWRSGSGAGDPESLVFHSAGADRTRVLAGRVGAGMVTEMSPATSVHTGPGVIGVAWLSPDAA